jgi:hypothetical protein
MTYTGRVVNGVVVFDGEVKPPDGTVVRVEEISSESNIGEELDRLAGKAVGLPADIAENHDHYIHGTLKRKIS